MIVFMSLPYKPLRITSGYGWRKDQVKNIPNATEWHDGVDIGRDLSKYASTAKDGGDVLAVMDGTVVDVGYNKARGNYVKIEHERENGNKVETFYQHLFSSISPSHGKVKAGDVIGRMGKTGDGSGLHLHFELRIAGKPVDPTRYLKNIGSPIDENAKKVQKRYNFSDNTMLELSKFKHFKSLMQAWLLPTPKKISETTRNWILKNVTYGAEVLRRVYGG